MAFPPKPRTASTSSAAPAAPPAPTGLPDQAMASFEQHIAMAHHHLKQAHGAKGHIQARHHINQAGMALQMAHKTVQQHQPSTAGSAEPEPLDMPGGPGAGPGAPGPGTGSY